MASIPGENTTSYENLTEAGERKDAGGERQHSPWPAEMALS